MADIVGQELGQVDHWLNTSSGFVLHSLDEATDQVEWIFQAREAATITRLGFRYGVRTGTPPVYKISLQGVDGSGRADGTIKGGGSPCSKTFTPPADATWNSTWQWITADNSFAVARGDFLAIVIKNDSGTINGSNFSSFTTALNAYKSDGGIPYAVTFNATGSVTTRAVSLPIFGYGSAGTAYGFPFIASTSLSINSGSTPDEVALAFTLPSGMGSTFQVLGARIGFQNLGAATTYKLILYDGTSVLQDVTVDSDITAAATRPHQVVYFDEVTLSTLTVGSTYRLAIQPQAATATPVLYQDVTAAADFASLPFGASWYWSQRTDAGAWSDTLTRRPMILPIVSAITATGGGLIGAGSLQGGLQ